MSGSNKVHPETEAGSNGAGRISAAGSTAFNSAGSGNLSIGSTVGKRAAAAAVQASKPAFVAGGRPSLPRSSTMGSDVAVAALAKPVSRNILGTSPAPDPLGSFRAQQPLEEPMAPSAFSLAQRQGAAAGPPSATGSHRALSTADSVLPRTHARLPGEPETVAGGWLKSHGSVSFTEGMLQAGEYYDDSKATSWLQTYQVVSKSRKDMHLDADLEAQLEMANLGEEAAKGTGEEQQGQQQAAHGHPVKAKAPAPALPTVPEHIASEQSGYRPPTSHHCTKGVGASRARASAKTVYMHEILQDCYEYHGVSRLFSNVLFYVLAVFVLFSNWSDPDGIFRNEMMDSMVAYGSEQWQTRQLNELTSMSEAVEYFTDFAELLLNDSQARGLPITDVRSGEYASVSVARMFVAYDACKYRSHGLACFRDDNVTLTSDRWNVPLKARYVYSKLEPPVGALLWNQSTASYEEAFANLASVRQDAAALAKYSVSVGLEMVAYNVIGEEPSHVYFHLAGHRLRDLFVQPKVSSKFIIVTNTIRLKVNYADRGTMMDFYRVALWGIFTPWLLFYILEEIHGIRQLWVQYDFGQHAKPSTLGTSVWRYITHWWNFMDCFAFTCTLAVTGTWWYFYATSFDTEGCRQFLVYQEHLDCALDYSQTRTGLITGTIMSCLLLGLRIYQFMKVHSGLNVFYTLFIHAWRAIKDFAYWFVYVFFLIGTTLIAVYQMSGGNPDFETRSEGLSALARVGFGFYDYDRFINNGIALGTWQPLAEFLFWMTVVVMVVVAQNILLAIFNKAYELAMRQAGTIHSTMFRVMVWRIVWYSLYLWQVTLTWAWFWATLRRRPYMWFQARFVQKYVYAYVINAKKKQDEFDDRLLARWAIANIPEMATLLEYFCESGTVDIYVRSPWMDPRVVDDTNRLTDWDMRGLPASSLFDDEQHPSWTTWTCMTEDELLDMLQGKAIGHPFKVLSEPAKPPAEGGKESKPSPTAHQVQAPPKRSEWVLLRLKKMMDVAYPIPHKGGPEWRGDLLVRQPDNRGLAPNGFVHSVLITPKDTHDPCDRGYDHGHANWFKEVLVPKKDAAGVDQPDRPPVGYAWWRYTGCDYSDPHQRPPPFRCRHYKHENPNPAKPRPGVGEVGLEVKPVLTEHVPSDDSDELRVTQQDDRKMHEALQTLLLPVVWVWALLCWMGRLLLGMGKWLLDLRATLGRGYAWAKACVLAGPDDSCDEHPVSCTCRWIDWVAHMVFMVYGARRNYNLETAEVILHEEDDDLGSITRADLEGIVNGRQDAHLRPQQEARLRELLDLLQAGGRGRTPGVSQQRNR